MRTLTYALIASTALCLPAMADDQIKVVQYSPLKRYDILGVVNHPTVITFPGNEVVYSVFLSDNGSKAYWRGPPTEKDGNGKERPVSPENNLPLWPDDVREGNLTVITCVLPQDVALTGEGCTSQKGTQKVYSFRLNAVPDYPGIEASANVTFNMIFKGVAPDAPTQAATPAPKYTPEQVKAWQDKQKATAEQAAAAEKIREDAAWASPDGKCHFTLQGKRPNSITPLCPQSNGQWTRIRFPGLSKKPAVYVGTCLKDKDSERLAHQHEDGDRIVVEEIAANFCLRLGDDVLDIINNAFDPVGKDPGTGTTSPNIVRQAIAAKPR